MSNNTINTYILKVSQRFTPLLDDWTIIYDPNTERKNTVEINYSKKRAVICRFDMPICTISIDEYLRHEILHVLLVTVRKSGKTIKNAREDDDRIIRGIENLYFGHPKSFLE